MMFPYLLSEYAASSVIQGYLLRDKTLLGVREAKFAERGQP